MTGKSLSTQQIAALWRAYKIRQTANYVATHCRVSRHTAAKYILNHNFAQRFVKLQAKANDILDDDHAKSLARAIKNVSNINIFIADALLDALKNKTFKPGTANYDRMVRLEKPLSQLSSLNYWDLLIPSIFYILYLHLFITSISYKL